MVLVPVDVRRLHVEGRYNYEALHSVSAFVGVNAGWGEALALHVTPMIGAVSGDLDGWIEWVRDGKRKQAFYMTSRTEPVLAFAGVWTMWREQLLTCSVLTTAALGELAEVHDRMPLILPRERWPEWLAGGGDASVLLQPMSPAELATIEVRPVRPDVGNVRNNGPHLLTAAEPAPVPEVTLF
jgi:hypothetical protein